MLKDIKDFFADIKVNKEIVVAHCPNTGSMMGFWTKIMMFGFQKNNDPKRKFKFTLEIIKG